MKQFKTQCYLTHGTTPVVVRPRQLFFPSGRGKRHAPSPWRGSQNSAAVTPSVPAQWPFGTGDHLVPGTREGDRAQHRQRPGRAGVPATQHRNRHQACKRCHTDWFLRKTAWGWSGELPRQQSAYRSRQGDGGLGEKWGDELQIRPRVPFEPRANLCHLLPRFCLPVSNYAAGLGQKQDPEAVTSVVKRGALWLVLLLTCSPPPRRRPSTGTGQNWPSPNLFFWMTFLQISKKRSTIPNNLGFLLTLPKEKIS